MVALTEVVPGERSFEDPNLAIEAEALGWRTVPSQHPGRHMFQRGSVSLSIDGKRDTQHIPAEEVALAASNGQTRSILVLRQTGFTLVVDSDAPLQGFSVSHSQGVKGNTSYGIGIGGLFSLGMDDTVLNTSANGRTVFQSPAGVLQVESASNVFIIDYRIDDPQFRAQEHHGVLVGKENGAAFYNRGGVIFVVPESSMG